jgi:hypothetical protein
MFNNPHMSGRDPVSNEHGPVFDSVAPDGMLLFPAQLVSPVSCHIVCNSKHNSNKVSRLLTENNSNSEQALSVSNLDYIIP